MKTMTWENYVHLAFDEIRMAGAGSPQVFATPSRGLDGSPSCRAPERIDVLDQQAAAPCRDG